MRRVKARAFRKDLGQWLGSGESLIIRRRGAAIGVYFPFQKADKAAAANAADALAATLEGIYAETGMTEDEFVAAFLAAGDEAMA